MAQVGKRGTKIVATIGGVSDSETMLTTLIESGVNVFRLNFSHGEATHHATVAKRIRQVAHQMGVHVGILADLQGPKLRLGKFEGGEAFLEAGAPFTLDTQDLPGDATRVSFPHQNLYTHIQPGQHLLLDDGKCVLKVGEVTTTAIHTHVVVGGKMRDRKGVNLPDISLPIPALTPKDIQDLKTILTMGVDYIALSFVQRAEDIEDLRGRIPAALKILAKIEKPQALDVLEEIMDAADGFMVARGDLGVELPLESVPPAQKRMVEMGQKKGKPVIVATQMLESMITMPSPTRAEVSDVAGAVYEGADAVMLSGESAIGAYPIEAVQTMNRIIRHVDTHDAGHKIHVAHQSTANSCDAIAHGAYEIAQDVGAKAIITISASGHTALRIARYRPEMPIIAISHDVQVVQQLALVWGVYALYVPAYGTFEEIFQFVCTHPHFQSQFKAGDKIVMTGGSPLGKTGQTNFVHVKEI